MVLCRNCHIIQSPIQTLALIDNLCNLLGEVVEQCGKKRNRDDNKSQRLCWEIVQRRVTAEIDTININVATIILLDVGAVEDV